MLSRLTVVALLAAPVAHAQTYAAGSTDLSRGASLLPGSAAFTDDAFAVALNPAGLVHAGGANLTFLHERNNVRALSATGAYGALNPLPFLGLGISYEVLAPYRDGPERNRFNLAFATGGELLSAGISVGRFGGGAVAGLSTVDVGLQSRPLRWLSAGALVRNVAAPRSGDVSLAREYVLALGVRPLGERVSLGVDWFLGERALSTSRLQYTAQALVVPGLRVLAGVSHGFEAATPVTLQLGLGLDLEHVGAAFGLASVGEAFNFQYAGRLSLDAEPSLVRPRTIAVVSTSGLGGGVGASLAGLLGLQVEDRFLRFLKSLEAAREDADLEAVLLKVEDTGLGLARAEEVRQGLERLRAAGKKVVVYLQSASDAEYLLATAADHLYASPEAYLLIDGLRASVLYLGGTAELLGITVDVARVGSYKNAPDSFTRKDMSAQQQEALQAFLDVATTQVQRRVSARRPLTAERWQASLDQGIKTPRQALELGYLDAVLTSRELEEKLKELFPGARTAAGFRRNHPRDLRWGTRRSIAVVPVLGSITGGRSAGVTTGAQSFVEALEQAAADSSVQAIVVRVDSGGGEAAASAAMYRAVLEAKKKKPVVASFGDTAASGGYYAAAGADEVWAQPTTLTGSIGIFFLKPAVRKLANGLAAEQVSVQRGKLAGLVDLFDPWTPEQQAAAQAWVDDGYQRFVADVARGRKLEPAQVDAVGQGRIWSGADAKERGLVDGLGGLLEAVAAARKRAGISPEDQDVELRVVGAGGGLLAAAGLASAAAGATDTLGDHLRLDEAPVPGAELAAPPLLRRLEALLGPSFWLLEEPALQARSEYIVTFR